MTDLTLAAAQTILSTALDTARREELRPVAVVVLDGRGSLKAAACEDGASLRRFDIAHGKAYGALALGIPSRRIHERAERQPYFVAAVGAAIGGALVPVPGGVLVRDLAGHVVGAVGVSGDASDADEAAALAGIAAAGLVGDAGLE